MNHSRVVYLTAAGSSAKSFLSSHFTSLKRDGFDVTLICTPDVKGHQVAEQAGINFHPVVINTNFSPFADLLSLVKLIQAFKKIQPHVVHGHMSKAGLLSMIAATACRVKVRIYHNHGMAFLSSEGLKKYFLRFIEKLTCRLATHIIFCGESTRLAAIGESVCTEQKSQVLGQGTISGVNLKRFTRTLSEPEITSLKDSLNIENNRKVVGFVGRIVAHKGIVTLLDAWDALPEATHSKTALVIAGEHQNDVNYEYLLNMSKKHPNIYYLERRDDIHLIYQAFDLLVLPSWHEGFPYSVLEAQALGVPAIVTNVSGNIDAIIDNETGKLIDVNNASNLANAIHSLLSNEPLRTAMSISATKRIQENFSEQHVIDNLLSFYSSLK